MTQKDVEIHLKGISISRGIGIGKAVFLSPEKEYIPNFKVNTKEVESEVLRYRRAITRGCDEINLLQNQLKKEKITEGVDILESYMQMMQDPLLTVGVENSIRQSCRNAEQVFYETINFYQTRFSKIIDPFFRERFKDIQDVSKRILSFLKESYRVSLADIPEESVVFAYDLTAIEVAEANITKISAFITTSGGISSHAAIVAKAKGIPYVTNIHLEGLEICSDAIAIVDGRTGEVFINPSEETILRYANIKKTLGIHFKLLSDCSSNRSETYDGYHVKLSANIEMSHEVNLLHEYGGHGVGLYRSEYEFLSLGKFPVEEEQFITYRRMVELMQGLPIVIRTFDIGGDKQMSCYPNKLETNPIMGCRAIRFLLQERDLFKSQLRAILRASIYGDVSILFPMISALSELHEAKQIFYEAQEELLHAGVPFSRNISIGCMIEVPSAAIISDLLAKECDFLSIGTNDLIQYSLAVDRSNQLISGLYTPTHPSVIRLIKLIVNEVNHQGIPVTVCGEVAADPRFTSLLLGLGVHELSVAPRHIPIIKNAIRSASIVDATALAEKVLTLASANEIQELLNEAYYQLVPDDCIYNC